MALGVACIAVGLAVWGFVQRSWANHKAREALVRQLATEAKAYMTRDPEQSMLLAAEAYGRFPTDITESVLRQVFARYNAMFGLMQGHQGGVGHAAFSPDGKLVVTASVDKTVRLWACRVCALAPALIADIRQRVKRPLSPQERLASGLSAIGGSPGQ